MEDTAIRPLIDTDDAISWDDEADIVIVGFGAAGACAALEASGRGGSVLAFDRFRDGGSTAASGGVYYGGGTPFQKEAGFDDDAEAMFAYLRLELGDIVSDATLRTFCEDSASNLQWLVDHGVPFSAAFTPEKTSLPGHGKYLYFSGDERAPASQAVARPAPRGHKTVGAGASGNVFWKRLNEAAEKRGVRIFTHSPVTRLVQDGSGRIVGVEVNAMPDGPVRARHESSWRKAVRQLGLVRSRRAERIGARLAAIEAGSTARRFIRARKGVILATGGFVYNRAMVRRYAPVYAEGIPIGTPGDDGSGIRLGLGAGGVAASMDRTCAAKSIAPPIAFIEGIMVNGSARRMINEDCYTAKLGRAIAESENGVAWLILDRRMRNAALRKSLPGNGRLLLIHCLPALMSLLLGSKKARTIAALARKCGLPEETLVQSIAAYNETALAGGEDPLGKKKDFVKAIARAPYYALNLSTRSKTSPLATFTLGGLVVDEGSGAVLRSDRSPIEGLYAAGRAALGIPSNFYISGLSIADCVFSGRRAGRSAMQSIS